MRGCFDALSITSLYTKCNPLFVRFFTRNRKMSTNQILISRFMDIFCLFEVCAQHNYAIAISRSVAADAHLMRKRHI